MPYGEIFIPGESKKEILISTYICHPSMASNELSGPVIAAYLAKLLRAKKMRFSYRILFMSETIGAICYINENLDNLRTNLFSGYVLTCLGDTNGHSLIEGISRIVNQLILLSRQCAIWVPPIATYIRFLTGG